MSELANGVAWTDDTRKLVYPSRQWPNPGFVPAELSSISSRDAYALSPDASRKQAAYYWAQSRTGDRVKTGLARNPLEWRPAVEAALARCQAPDADHPIDVDVEAATVALELCPVFAAVPFWIGNAGVAFALRALIRCHQLVNSGRVHGYGSQGLWIIESRDYGYTRPEGADTGWRLLRGVLAEAVAPIYDEAHGIADAARQPAPATFRDAAIPMWIAFAFPDERGWSDAVGAHALALAANARRGYTPPLARFVSVASVETATSLLGSTTNTALADADGLTLLAHHGEAALPAIAAAITNAANNAARQQACKWLLQIRTPASRELFAKLARQAKNKIVTKFASEHAKLVAAPPRRAAPRGRAKR